MIFGRRKKAPATADEAGADQVDERTETVEESDDADDVDDADADLASGTDDETSAAGPADIDVAALDATEWRTHGPFEVSELTDADRDDSDEPDDRADDEGHADDDEEPRVDLGSLIITAVPGSELRLQVNESSDIVSAMLVLPVLGPVTNGAEPEVVSSSALELSAYAAPRSGGLWAELRDEISEAATEVDGSAQLAEGPFGVELRRLLPVTTPTGEQGYQPSRMWVAEGPRWLLRGIVYGQAAVETDDEDPAVAAVLEAFRAVVVRRGDEAMAPGDLLPMTMPADVQPIG